MGNISKLIYSRLRRFVLLLAGKDVTYMEYRRRIEELIQRGLKIGKNVFIEDDVFFDRGYPYLISIGDNCSISKYVAIFAHDDSLYKFTGGYGRIGRVEIRDNCFIGERAIILPGITIGPNVMIAAGSVVNKDIPPNTCVAGVPARVYAKLDQWVEKNMEGIRNGCVFDYKKVRKSRSIDEDVKLKIIDETAKGICYVKGKGENFTRLTWNR